MTGRPACDLSWAALQSGGQTGSAAPRQAVQLRTRSRLARSAPADARLSERPPPTREAVTTCRELAAADPGRYRADLASSLANLGARLSEVERPHGRRQSAIYRELAAADPDR